MFIEAYNIFYFCTCNVQKKQNIILQATEITDVLDQHLAKTMLKI